METVVVFNLTKAEVESKISESNKFTLPALNDKVGYDHIKQARIELRNIRVLIEKAGAEKRKEALEYQRAVIATEKEYTDLIKGAEARLKSLEDQIDEEQEKIKRSEHLPNRRQVMEVLGVEVTDDFLLTMNNEQFTTYYNQKHADVIAERERILQEQEDALVNEKNRIADEEDRNNRDEKDRELKRLQKEERDRQAEESRKADDDKKAAESDSNRKYINFLNKYKVTEEGMENGQWFIKRMVKVDGKVKIDLFQKVGEVII